MPSRAALALVIALLILSVGIGSAFLLSGASSGRGSQALSALQAEPTGTTEPGEPSATSVPPTSTPEGEPAPTSTVTSTPDPPTLTPTETAIPTITPTDTPFPTPAPERYGGPVVVPNNHKGPRWVTLQAGHWRNSSLPGELGHLIGQTGAYSGGVSEVDITVAVARLAAQRLYERGYSVDVLDATVPPNYTSDLFLALHADGSNIRSVRGFKAVAPWGFPPASDKFVEFLYEEYGLATSLPTDARTSDAMANYYAFNPIRYRHALNPHVPAALLEMGFVTNPADREVLVNGQERVAWGIANAVDRYFRSGVAGATPSPYPSFTVTPIPTHTATSTSTPSSTPSATATATVTPLPTELGLALIQTAAVTTPGRPTLTPRLPTATVTVSPTSTPVIGIITADGRWLPPLSPNGRRLPTPGTDAAWVFLGEASDDPHRGYSQLSPNWRPAMWRQYYVPSLGRSIWIKGRLHDGTE
jgi:hypothetical protein